MTPPRIPDLYVYQQSTLPANVVSNFDSVTVANGGTLTIGGGATLNVANGIVVTGNSSIILEGVNNTAQVAGKWQGSGVTINAASVQVDLGSSISADGQGYAGSGCNGPGAGPGGGPQNCDNPGNGGSYGGLGGGPNQAAGTIYGRHRLPPISALAAAADLGPLWAAQAAVPSASSSADR